MGASRQSHREHRSLRSIERGLQGRNVRLVQFLQVIDAPGAPFGAQLHPAERVELIDVHLGRNPRCRPRREPRLRFFQTEVALLAERIDVVHRAGGLGQEFFDRQGRPFRGRHPARHCVQAEQGRLDGDRRLPLQSADDAQHLQLRLDGQTVPGFNFQRADAVVERAFKPFPCRRVERVFGHGLQPLGRIQDAAAALGDGLVRQAIQPIQKLARPIRRIHQMRVAVHPTRQHKPPLAIHYLQARPIRDALEIRHPPEVRDAPVLDREPRVVEHAEFIHVSTCEVGGGLLVRSDEAFDVGEEDAHGHKASKRCNFGDMAGNSFGDFFRVTTFGESHGVAIGGVIDGCPAGLPLDVAAVQAALDRRRPGQSELTTQRKESDRVEFLSGLFEGVTTGTPIAFLLRNEDARSQDYEAMKAAYRPSHADFTYDVRFGRRDPRGGGRASARETAARVVAGAVADQILSRAGISVSAYVERVGDIAWDAEPAFVPRAEVDVYAVRCPDGPTAERMNARIAEVARSGDSLGGALVVVAQGVPAGWGAPVFDKLQARIAAALWSLPAVKFMEIGSGIAGTYATGSTHNDAFIPSPSGGIATATNRSGGIQGGISNGMPIVVRLGFKPTATIQHAQATVSPDGVPTELAARGRHDPCVLPRAVPIAESMLALVLADAWLAPPARLDQLHP